MTMVPIQSISLSSNGSIVFSNIPQIYKHLQIRVLGRGGATFTDGLSQYINFNQDFGSNYGWHVLFGPGSTPSTFAPTPFPTTVISTPQILTDAGSPSGLFGTTIVDILDYSNTSRFKNVKVFGGFDKTSNGRVSLGSGYWAANAAINSITLQSDSGLAAGSRADLYGIVG
jgi:hypothetical protein